MPTFVWGISQRGLKAGEAVGGAEAAVGNLTKRIERIRPLYAPDFLWPESHIENKVILPHVYLFCFLANTT